MYSISTASELTPAQRARFAEAGWLHLPHQLDTGLLTKLRKAVDALCTDTSPKLNVAEVTGTDGLLHIICVNNIVASLEPVFAEVLASEWLRGIAQCICGNDYFLVQDFAVIKTLGDGAPVNWHQDVISPQPGKAIMIGLYLDASDNDNGALRIIPHSHHSKAGICGLEKMPYESLSMQPGDVLVHDLMLAHSSGVLTSQPKRRVVYFEFMSAQYAVEQGIYPPHFVQQRSRVVPAVLRMCKGDETAHTELEQVYAMQLRVKAAAYCFGYITNVSSPATNE
jgi:hypothetical protein